MPVEVEEFVGDLSDLDLIDDDTEFEITPLGIQFLLDDLLGRYHAVEEDFSAQFTEHDQQALANMQRWVDERDEARETVVNLSQIIDLFVSQFEEIAAYPERSTTLAQEALCWVERTDGEEGH